MGRFAFFCFLITLLFVVWNRKIFIGLFKRCVISDMRISLHSVQMFKRNISTFCRNDIELHCGSRKIIFILPIGESSDFWRTLHWVGIEQNINFSITRRIDNFFSVIPIQIGSPQKSRMQLLDNLTVKSLQGTFFSTYFPNPIPFPIYRKASNPVRRWM